MERLNGVVSWFDEKKGWGFIKHDGRDYFLHYADIQTEGFKILYANDPVSFVPAVTDKGIKATLVTPANQITK